jgi:hypothetical protein
MCGQATISRNTAMHREVQAKGSEWSLVHLDSGLAVTHRKKGHGDPVDGGGE